MEELRDDIVQKLICYVQGACRGYLRRKAYATRKLQRYVGITLINYSHIVILGCLARKNQNLNSRKKFQFITEKGGLWAFLAGKRLRRIWSQTRLIPGLPVLHFLSPWTNDPHKIDPPG